MTLFWVVKYVFGWRIGLGWGGSNLDLEVFGSTMSGLGSTRIWNISSRCGFSWFLQIERTGSTHFDAVATPFLPFSLPWTRAGLAGVAAGGCGVRDSAGGCKMLRPDARRPGWGAASGCGEVQATGAGGR